MAHHLGLHVSILIQVSVLPNDIVWKLLIAAAIHDFDLRVVLAVDLLLLAVDQRRQDVVLLAFDDVSRTVGRTL